MSRRDQLRRAAAEAEIERLIALLDELDGDADAEPDDDAEQDGEDCCAAGDDDPRPGAYGVFGMQYGAGDPDDAEASDGDANRLAGTHQRAA